MIYELTGRTKGSVLLRNGGFQDVLMGRSSTLRVAHMAGSPKKMTEPRASPLWRIASDSHSQDESQTKSGKLYTHSYLVTDLFALKRKVFFFFLDSDS